MTEGDGGVSDVAVGSDGALRRRRRRLRGLLSRLTPSMVVGVLLGAVAFVGVAVILRDRRDSVLVVVPVETVATGARLEWSGVRVVEMPAVGGMVDVFLSEAEVVDGELVASRPLLAGEPVLRSATSPGSGGSAGGRQMTIGLADWGVVGGEVLVGERIDLIDTSGVPQFVLQDAEVLASGGDVGGGMLGSNAWVSVEVTEAESLDVARVIDADSFVVVRIGGAG